MRFADLEQQSGLPKATLHQLLGSLLSAGWLTREPEGGWFSVGLGAFEVGTRFPVQQTLREVSAPILADLLAEFNETIHFGMLTDGDVVYIDRAVSSHPVRYAAPLGHRLPAYATGLGKAMLSGLPDDDVREFYPEGLHAITDHTITSMDSLIEDLRLSRARGYSLEDQESTPGVRCVGVLVPVKGRVLAMSMAIPISRATPEDLIAAAPRLQEAAVTIGERLAVLDWFAGVGPIEVDG
jgi:DNA-binding IclR family transcriptional regulator